MAFMMRRWRLIVVMNTFAVAGFISFWGKCGDRLNKMLTGHTQFNGSSSDSIISQEVLLKRLDSLEDVVYKQLSGFSKSIGLIEGKSVFSGILTAEEEKQAKYMQEKYGYNAFMSDRISLDRSIQDYRPSKCKHIFYPKDLPQISLIFIFVDEALSVILRSVHSAINHTPPHLLKEIILVDDYSDDEQLKGLLEEYVNKRYPGLVKILRNQKREGLIRARIEGWKIATGEVTGFFDAHVEFTPVWAEPVLSRIKQDPTRIILPSIDNIDYKSFDLERYEDSGHGFNWELWCMYISPPKQWWDEGDPSAPIRTPSMIGCSFVANRHFFGELGLLDSGMDVYGGENVELGIRVWMCGGSMEVLPCSRVAHVARARKPYHNNIGFHTRRNALRVAEVWLDEYKSNVYIAWNIPMENHGIDYGDISERVALRKSLQCKNFEWYLDNVYPEMKRYNNTLFYGEIRNSDVSHLCMDQGDKENHTAVIHPCHGWNPQLGRYTKEGYLFLGPLGSTGDDTKCVIDDIISSFPQLVNCNEVSNDGQRTWNFTQNEAIVNRATGRCLEVVKANAYFNHMLVLQACSGQRWTIKNTVNTINKRDTK